MSTLNARSGPVPGDENGKVVEGVGQGQSVQAPAAAQQNAKGDRLRDGEGHRRGALVGVPEAEDHGCRTDSSRAREAHVCEPCDEVAAVEELLTIARDQRQQGERCRRAKPWEAGGAAAAPASLHR